jgi:hypothetical protein
MERTAQVEALVLLVVDGDDPATRLQALSVLRVELDSLESTLAGQALRAGLSWREIGEALGVTKQAAHRRHSLNVASTDDPEADRAVSAEVAVSVSARRAVRLARQEATRLGVAQFSTEHLLLGLLQCGDRRAGELLERLGVTLAVMRDALKPTLETSLKATRQTDGSTGAGVAAAAISPVAKRTLEGAVTRASARAGSRLTALDILYCALAHREAGAARTLERLGVDVSSAREQITELEAVA